MLLVVLLLLLFMVMVVMVATVMIMMGLIRVTVVMNFAHRWRMMLLVMMMLVVMMLLVLLMVLLMMVVADWSRERRRGRFVSLPMMRTMLTLVALPVVMVAGPAESLVVGVRSMTPAMVVLVPGRRRMSRGDFLNGRRLGSPGSRKQGGGWCTWDRDLQFTPDLRLDGRARLPDSCWGEHASWRN